MLRTTVQTLAAFANLIACQKQFSNYDLNLDLDRMYETKKDAIFKDFVKCSVEFVQEYNVKESDASEKEVEKQIAELSQLISDSTVNVDDHHTIEIISVQSDPQSQVMEFPREPCGQHPAVLAKSTNSGDLSQVNNINITDKQEEKYG